MLVKAMKAPVPMMARPTPARPIADHVHFGRD
jgi:hypothetical protein